MSNNNSSHSWTSNPVLHFGNVETHKTREQNAIEFHEKKIEELKENND